MTRWFPIAPGTTLPTAPAAVGGQITATRTVPVWNETLLISASSKTQLAVNTYGYSLTLLNEASLTTKTATQATRVMPVVNLGLSAFPPSFSFGAQVDAPSADIAIQATPPVLVTGASVSPPSIDIALATLEAESAGPPNTVVQAPASTVSVSALMPALASGVSVATPSKDVAVVALTPSVSTVLTDPYFSSVSLLLHCEGTNGSTSFVDSSANGFSATANGNAQISTAQAKFGSASCVLDGSGDYITFANNSAFNFGTGDFTIEYWAYPTSFATAFESVSYGTAGSSGFYVQLNTTSLNFGVTNAPNIISVNHGISTGAWTHVAVTRASGTYRAFVNGSLVSTVTGRTDNLDSSTVLRIGVNRAINSYATGHIDDVRLTKGVARYTSSFTAPTAAFPDS